MEKENDMSQINGQANQKESIMQLVEHVNLPADVDRRMEEVMEETNE